MRCLWVLCASLSACYGVPEELPGFDGVPIEPSSACAPSRDSRVSCVIDGDTLDVDKCGDEVLGERFRMLGIDAPELASDGQPAECFATQARSGLDDLLTDRDVRLEFDRECTDAFGRSLAWFFFEDDDEDVPVNANVWLVESGLARVFREFEFEELRYSRELQDAEDSAKAANIGLWGACGD
ncbi:MAG: thermonuclease family protein [Myxococcota bacterium]